MMKNIGLLIFLLGYFTFVTGQEYSPKRDRFAKEIQTSMAASLSSDELQFVKKDLLPFINSPTDLPDEVFTKMVNTSNLLLEKRMKNHPYVYNYVYSIYLLHKKENIKGNYEQWQRSLDELLSIKNTKKATQFLDFSTPFWENGILGGRSNVIWIYRGGKPIMKSDKKGPYVEIDGGDLLCELDNKRPGVSRKVIDSVLVSSTQGSYYPLEEEFFGKGGKITWEKVNVSTKDLYAEIISDYVVNTKKADLKVDSVNLKTPQFKQLIKGSLMDRAYNINREEDKNHPRFQSFEKSLFIKDFVKDVDYKGGFRYEGANFVGTSVGGTPATLTIYKKDQTVFGKIYADVVTNTPIKLFANNAAITIYLGEKDSITHHELTFDYFKDKNTFEFTRTKEGGGIAPFIDTYHQVDMFVPKITWVKDSSNITLTYGMEIGAAERVANLESKNYFTDQSFSELQGITNQNPLLQLYNYCYKYDEYELTMGKFATALGRTPEQSQQIFFILRNQGFISYNTQTKLITVNDKTKRYIDASNGRIDYDNIIFTSDLRIGQMPSNYTAEDIRKNPQLQEMDRLIKERNQKRRNIRDFGTIDLTTLDLNLNAIERVNISQKNFTFVAPDNDQLTVLKNRDLRFTGWIRSGKMEINVRKGNYDYNKNLFNLEETTETLVSVKPQKVEDGKGFIFLNSFISDAKGVLYVDDPNNRSGKDKEITNFPKLDIRNRARVFYNDDRIQRGAYDSTRFYFVMDPVLIDSLVNFDDRVFALDGELISAGIFPKFREKLVVMPDYSLGFSRMSPKGGYPFYETDAMYDNKIVLSNNGLQGSGKIEFVHSLSESAQFTFLPDSTIGVARFTNDPVEKGVQFPDVKGQKVSISYNPRKAYLNVYSMEQPIVMFDSIHYIGHLMVTKNGMTGNGLIDMTDANLVSKVFNFTRWKALAKVSDFSIRNHSKIEGQGKNVFVTENVNSDLDFKERKGIFDANMSVNGKKARQEFPENKFYCEMDRSIWNMDDEKVDLESRREGFDLTAGVGIMEPNFFSTHAKKDGLKFMVPKARYDISEGVIHCTNMKYLDIADSRIFPFEGKLNILQGGDIEKLKESKIISNIVNQYYTFTEVTVDIQSSKRMEGSGKYMFKDVNNDSLPIAIHRIYVDTAGGSTIALGNVGEDEDFKLSPYFDYYGKVKIQTANPLIEFDGATRIIHDCSEFARSWMAFKSEIDPKNIQIPVSSTMQTLEGVQIMAGLVWHDSPIPDEIRVYPTFLSELESAEDKNGIIIAASGYLQYNHSSKEYQISNLDKLVNRNEKGNYLSLHTGTCSLRGDGKISLGMDFDQATVETYGTVNYENKTKETTMNLTAYFQFPTLDDGALEKWISKASKDVNLMPLDWNNSTLEQAIKEVKDEKTSDAIKNEFIQKREVRRMPKEMEDGIVITGIQLKTVRDLNENGFITALGNASLVNVYKRTVFKQIPFHAFFGKVYSQQTTGDTYQFSLDIPGTGNCFFDYQTTRKKGKFDNGILLINTNDEELKSAFSSKKEKQMKKGNFSYMLNENSASYGDFLRRF